jgi:CRISPR-associated protein Cas2
MSPRVKETKYDKYLPGRHDNKDERLELSEYKIMWIFAMFDLPTTSKEDKKEYTLFRKVLLEEGFEMYQFSVYGRAFPTEEASESHRKRIKEQLPPEGQVRLLMVTDKQFGKMDVFYGRKRGNPEEAPSQMTLF